MQKNPGARTIESDLESALYLAKAVPEADKCCPNRYEWARAARTDKGVSAAGQVVSGRFYVDPPGFIDRLNENLDERIRVFGFKRVTNSFSAKKFCDRRRYVYLLPVFSLDSNKHMDRESVLKSFGSSNVLAKCVECSERGRKVLGVMGNRKNNGQKKEENIEENEHMALKEEENEENEHMVLKEEIEVSSTKDNMDTETEVVADEMSKFEYGEKEKARFNAILKRYEGTHNFHNFTTRTKAEDPAAKRYIISFNADTTVSIDGIEFVRCEVVGQSFMLHQIRKMIGFAVAMMRNCCPESLMDIALRRDININVPTAPEVGLYLDECFFTSYNDKWKDTHETVSMEAYAEQAEEFKMKYIFSHIASMEHKEGAVALWLHSLNHRNYSDFLFHEKIEVSKAPVEQPQESLNGFAKLEQPQEINQESVIAEKVR